MKLQHQLNSTPPAFSRLLSLVLLAFIVCGTTVEAAHTHGNLLSSHNLNSAAQFSDPANDSKLSTNSPGCGECLICQLQQHFQSTAITAPSSIAPLTEASHSIQSNGIGADSQTVVTRIGRAPPQISC